MSDQTYRRPIHWRSTALTDVGCVRKVNEDSVLELPERNLWVVADGMGGHAVGEVASQKVVEALRSVEFSNVLANDVDALEDALVEVNQHIIGYADILFDNATMGSTVALLYIRGYVGVCMWVGDSRLYRYRNGKLDQLSRDHSQVEQMIQMGLIKEDEAASHPNSNVITRAVGVEDELYVDINVFSVRVGDTFMLCSDGLYNAVDFDNIVESMTIRETSECGQSLLDKALSNNAKDNVSVVVVKGSPGKV